MQAEFREAVATDIAALFDLEIRSFSSDRLSRESIRRLVRSNSAAVIVAVIDRSVRGYAIVLFRARTSGARLYSLAVDPDFRGLGSRLLDAAETASVRRGCRSMRLEVRDDNTRAVALYMRSGYIRTGERLQYYADGARALCFKKQLTESAGDSRPGTVAA